MSYVTAAIVDSLLGAGWALASHKPRAVIMANAWLAERIRRDVDTPTPAAILQAGAEVARDAGAGLLYKAEAREVSATTVSAGGGVSVAKSFTPGSKAMTAGETLAIALIKPWTRRPSSITLLRI
jgi:hypothetical protein